MSGDSTHPGLGRVEPDGMHGAPQALGPSAPGGDWAVGALGPARRTGKRPRLLGITNSIPGRHPRLEEAAAPRHDIASHPVTRGIKRHSSYRRPDRVAITPKTLPCPCAVGTHGEGRRPEEARDPGEAPCRRRLL